MATPANILQNVQTYQMAELAFLLNSFCGIRMTNKRFDNFQDKPGNLGDTVTYDNAPRFIGYNGLVITQQPSVQRKESLAVTQAENISSGYTDQQFIFNVEEYMDRFGRAAVIELGSNIESDILRNIVSGVTINDPQNVNYGQLQVNSGPYRFYGDGVTQINSYGQLAQALSNFRDLGASRLMTRGILPMTVVPGIITTGLQQFSPTINEKDKQSWMLGSFSNCEWYESNLLPVHYAGDIGNAAAPNNVMTVVSVNDPTGVNVTSITFTEPTGGTDANAIKAGDLMQFNDGVAGLPNLRALTFTGHEVSAQPVQFRAIANAATVSGTVTVQIQTVTDIGLVWAQNQNQNINQTIQAGMKVTVLPSHRAGLIDSGNQFYMAMPKLPDESPFTTVNTMDPDSGASIRHYFGSQFGQNNRAYVRDSIWGSQLNSDNCMRLIFPI